MNEFTRKMKPSLSADKVKRTQKKSRAAVVMAVLLPAVIFAFVMICFRIHYTTQIEKLNIQATRLDNEIDSVRYNIQNVRNRKDTLCSLPHIRKQIVRFNLPLVPRQPSQLTHITVGRNGQNHQSNAGISFQNRVAQVK